MGDSGRGEWVHSRGRAAWVTVGVGSRFTAGGGCMGDSGRGEWVGPTAPRE